MTGRPYRKLGDPIRTVGAVLEASNYHPERSGRNHLRVLATARRYPASAGRGGARARRADGTPRTAASAATRSGCASGSSVAGALLGEPRLLVLDEPANGLDPEGIRWLRNFLRSFADDGGTVFISSHVLAEVPSSRTRS